MTDLGLLRRIRQTDRTVVLSTGMSTMGMIQTAVETVGRDRLFVTHCTSTYPCPVDELNLRMIGALRDRFACPVGYSGHEVGLPTTPAAVSMGACYVERHITLDRAMWGSDHSASIEPAGFARLVRQIREVEAALGDGVKRVYSSEEAVMSRLRNQ